MRARLAIAVSGITVELREVVLRNKPPQLLALSPKATVPVLLTQLGEVIDESLDIMLWALSHHDPEYWLPANEQTKTEMLTLVEQCDLFFKPQLDRYKYASRLPDESGIIARDEASEFLFELDRRLENQDWLFGSRVGIADMAIITFVRQFANVDRAWFDDQKWVNLIRWLEAFLANDRFTSMMDKYKQWELDDERVLFGQNSYTLKCGDPSKSPSGNSTAKNFA